MRIVRARILQYARKLDGRSWNPVSRWTERRAPLVIVETSDGVVGCGEAWSKQHEIGRVFDALGTLLAARVVGRVFKDADAIGSLHEAGAHDWPGSAALSAVDMALWDARARTQQQPLWRVLGGSTDKVNVYASGGLYRDGTDVFDLACSVYRFRDEGFGDVKIKVGGVSLEQDLERIAAVRQTIDRDGALWVDAVNQLSSVAAIEYALAYRAAGADAIQAPVAFDDFVSMAAIGRESMPVIAGESEFSFEAFDRLLQDAQIAMLQLNLGLCGGYTGAQRIAALARSRNASVTVQAHGTAVLLASSLHWGAAASAHSVEFHRFHDHLQRALPPLRIDRGVISLGDSGESLAIHFSDAAIVEPDATLTTVSSLT